MIQKAGSALGISGRCNQRVAELYWKQKDLPGVVALVRAGIYYALGRSLICGSREILKKPADKVSMAHWLVGAHLLATADFALAADQFQRGHDVIPPSGGIPALRMFPTCTNK